MIIDVPVLLPNQMKTPKKPPFKYAGSKARMLKKYAASGFLIKEPKMFVDMFAGSTQVAYAQLVCTVFQFLCCVGRQEAARTVDLIMEHDFSRLSQHLPWIVESGFSIRSAVLPLCLAHQQRNPMNERTL